MQETTKNPLPSILEIIPMEVTLVDSQLLDKIRITLIGCGVPAHEVSDAYIMLLLHYLHDNNYTELQTVTISNVSGWVFLIKRI
jgi:hypothetical protein